MAVLRQRIELTLSDVRDAACGAALSGKTLRETIRSFTDEGVILTAADRRAIAEGHAQGEHDLREYHRDMDAMDSVESPEWLDLPY